MLRTIFLSIALMLPAGHASAELLYSYKARLSIHDHQSSSGIALNSSAAVIRQDRDNFYSFQFLDPEDEADSFFKDKKNRMRLEKMLEHGNLSEEIQAIIMNGTPVVRIDIFTDHVEVSIVEQ